MAHGRGHGAVGGAYRVWRCAVPPPAGAGGVVSAGVAPRGRCCGRGAAGAVLRGRRREGGARTAEQRDDDVDRGGAECEHLRCRQHSTGELFDGPQIRSPALSRAFPCPSCPSPLTPRLSERPAQPRGAQPARIAHAWSVGLSCGMASAACCAPRARERTLSELASTACHRAGLKPEHSAMSLAHSSDE